MKRPCRVLPVDVVGMRPQQQFCRLRAGTCPTSPSGAPGCAPAGVSSGSGARPARTPVAGSAVGGFEKSPTGVRRRAGDVGSDGRGGGAFTAGAVATTATAGRGVSAIAPINIDVARKTRLRRTGPRLTPSPVRPRRPPHRRRRRSNLTVWDKFRHTCPCHGTHRRSWTRRGDGLEAAPARGRTGGQWPRCSAWRAKIAQDMYEGFGPDGRREQRCSRSRRELGVTRPTVYRHLQPRAG